MDSKARRQGWAGRRLGMEALEERRLLAADFELLKDIVTTPSNASSVPEELTVVGDVTYFVARTSTLGPQLWETDGTEAGTLLVKEIRNGGYLTEPHSLTNVHGTLYFVAFDDLHGEELWKSDGTTAGTVLVKDIAPGRDGSNIRGLTVVGDDLFFTAGVDRDIELWKSDGTAEGTTLVKDIRDDFGSHPRYHELDGDWKTSAAVRKIREAKVSLGAGDAMAAGEDFPPGELDESATGGAFRTTMR